MTGARRTRDEKPHLEHDPNSRRNLTATLIDRMRLRDADHGAVIVELPPDHPLYAMSYRVPRLPQVANIAFWERTGGETSERGEESERASLHGIHGPDGRLMVLIAYNNDVQDAWQWSDDPRYPAPMTALAYRFAVNYVIYAIRKPDPDFEASQRA